MTALALILLLAPAAPREPVGGPDSDRIEAPLERRVASLLAGERVSAGMASVVPLYARVPSEAGHGRPADVGWADDDLRARLIVEDGRPYLRIVNGGPQPLLLAAGTIFARGGVEVAVARDAVIPGDYAALVPAAALGATEEGAKDLAIAGALPPRGTGAILAGAVIPIGERPFLGLLRSGPVAARREGLEALLRPAVGGFGGTAVGAVFLVGDRPVAAHVFARHDLFVHALPGLLEAFAVEVREAEISARGVVPPRMSRDETRHRALAWLRAMARIEAEWAESYGAGFETVVRSRSPMAAGHAVVDQQRTLVHAGFYATPFVPEARQEGVTVGPVPPPRPPGTPNETPAGFRERRPRPTVEDERRGELNPNPGPHPTPPRADSAGGPGTGPAAGGQPPGPGDPAPGRPR